MAAARYSRRMLEQRSCVRVRKARLADAEALAEVFKTSWSFAYTGLLPESHLRTMIARRGTGWWRTMLRGSGDILVLQVADRVAGYATMGRSRGNGAIQGEIYELYLDPLYQGLGLGEHLFEGCRNVLDTRRLNGLAVWALIDNAPACHFYWRRGGRPRTSVMDSIGGKKFEKVAFVWP